jgi:hypothetical protein
MVGQRIQPQHPDAGSQYRNDRRSAATLRAHREVAAHLINAAAPHASRASPTPTARVPALRFCVLDRSDEVSVVAHIRTERKMQGIVIPDGVPHWPDAPPAEFMAVLMG